MESQSFYMHSIYATKKKTSLIISSGNCKVFEEQSFYMHSMYKNTTSLNRSSVIVMQSARRYNTRQNNEYFFQNLRATSKKKYRKTLSKMLFSLCHMWL